MTHDTRSWMHSSACSFFDDDDPRFCTCMEPAVANFAVQSVERIVAEYEVARRIVETFVPSAPSSFESLAGEPVVSNTWASGRALVPASEMTDGGAVGASGDDSQRRARNQATPNGGTPVRLSVVRGPAPAHAGSNGQSAAPTTVVGTAESPKGGHMEKEAFMPLGDSAVPATAGLRAARTRERSGSGVSAIREEQRPHRPSMATRDGESRNARYPARRTEREPMTLTRRTPLSRSAPPKRKAAKRAWKTPRCIYETPTGRHTCRKPQEHIERCKPHADAYLDGLVRDILGRREQLCQVPHASVCKCGGPIQVNHGFRRGHYGTRWNLHNVVNGCAGLNTWAHHNEARWHHIFEDFVVGPQVYAELRALAYHPPKLDYVLIRDELTARLEANRD